MRLEAQVFHTEEIRTNEDNFSFQFHALLVFKINSILSFWEIDEIRRHLTRIDFTLGSLWIAKKEYSVSLEDMIYLQNLYIINELLGQLD